LALLPTLFATATIHLSKEEFQAHLEPIVEITHFLDGVQKKTPTSKRLEMMMEWMNDLNQEQKQAVMEIVWKQHGEAPYCIYGPPGTGKTTTVVESIVQVLKCNPQSRILVCAPSDAACDVVAMRLLSVLPPRFKMLRVNWWARNSSSLPPSLLSCSPMDEEGFFDMPCKEQIQQADVVICQCFVAGFLDIDVTMNTCNEGPWMENHFTHAFIDESSQSFEYESLIPLLKLGRGCSIILAGDPKQLGPTTRSKCASRNGLSMSLQERLMGLPLYRDQSNFCTVTKLLDNYRSHKALLRVPSELFYDGSLRCKATPEITSACKDFELLRNGAHFPMMAYDVSDGTERSKIDTPSFFNLEECHAIVKIIKSLLSSPNVHIHAGQIAVITCFRAQVLKLRNILRAEGLPSINVGVVEDFQGQETSVVLISTVLTREHERWKSGAKSGLGFMTDPKKFNVAITRASALCVIVGKIAFLENSGSYWSALMEHIRKNGGISGDSNAPKEEEEDYDDLVDYGIGELISRIEGMKILGAGHEMDRYMLAMRGYYEDSPEWRVCL
jgi:DNA polymerase III delta prime subunit